MDNFSNRLAILYLFIPTNILLAVCVVSLKEHLTIAIYAYLMSALICLVAVMANKPIRTLISISEFICIVVATISEISALMNG